MKVYLFQFPNRGDTVHTDAVAVQLSAGQHDDRLCEIGKFRCTGKSCGIDQIGLIRKNPGKFCRCTSGIQKNSGIRQDQLFCLFCNLLFCLYVAHRTSGEIVVCTDHQLYRFCATMNPYDLFCRI